MNEEQLIKKIEQLKQIKPKSEWVFLTKQRILEEERKGFSFERLFTALRKPALIFALRGVIAAAVVAAGAFGFLYYLNSGNDRISLPEFSFLESQENKQLLASLQEIEQTLQGINSSLAKLAGAENQKQALTMTEVVKGTAGRSEKALKEIKEKASAASEKVLAGFNSIEGGFRKLEEESFGVQKEILKSLVEDLRERSLTDENKARLEKAIEYYEEGKYSEAIILIQKIGS